MDNKDVQKNMIHTLFGNFDPSTIAANADFKEDSVRAVIIDPVLRELGWQPEAIVRSKALSHPVLKVGTSTRHITLIPDYLLKIDESYAWVLDAKHPAQNVLDANNVEQVYSYAVHREIRSVYFALCNGIEFALFRTSDPEHPALYFRISEIDTYWAEVTRLLSPESFQTGKKIEYEKPFAAQTAHYSAKEFDYAARPLLTEIPVTKQRAKRYYGCNAYFTRQAWNVVAEYIKNYSAEGDVVLDPFGGSGITAVEALINKRKAIHIDINPLSVFMTQALAAPVKPAALIDAFYVIKQQYLKNEPKTEAQINEALEKYKLPKDLPLPKGSDVETVLELFTPAQKAQLAYLKELIKKIKDKNTRLVLMLAFYNTVSVVNKTFHKTPKGGGNHFGYYYRYRIAPEPANFDTLNVFENKFKRVYDGKKEIEKQAALHKTGINEMFLYADIRKASATDLSFLENESIDYIYTDPPYGKNIQYLDLSIMWNTWLDLDVSEKDYELEAIEDGSREKSRKEYKQLIAKSIEEMYRVLKFDRWLSFVFAHKNPEFWHLIIETCEKCGFEYKGSVAQNNGQTDFKKRQNPFTVLSGELIINFRKVKSPRAILKANLGMDIGDLVMQTIEGVIAKNNGAAIDEINVELITKGLELGFLHLLQKEYSDIEPLLRERFDYSTETQKYTIRRNSKFTAHIDVRLRVRYYIISYLTAMERQGKTPSFNEIVYNIMPLLKNGIFPEHQTIEEVLEDIADKTGTGGWRLKRENRGLFE
ncbi:MAG: type I restriction enzyme HsdR N-terminal domain-containing protein [Spirochaetaceae bacterium]|jgi:DNA modification methylase|nr:type I restriction enzyme HsdR N-terminal domain-containing protein [Spirochaetaceae bacterium]